MSSGWLVGICYWPRLGCRCWNEFSPISLPPLRRKCFPMVLLGVKSNHSKQTEKYVTVLIPAVFTRTDFFCLEIIPEDTHPRSVVGVGGSVDRPCCAVLLAVLSRRAPSSCSLVVLLRRAQVACSATTGAQLPCTQIRWVGFTHPRPKRFGSNEGCRTDLLHDPLLVPLNRRFFIRS